MFYCKAPSPLATWQSIASIANPDVVPGNDLAAIAHNLAGVRNTTQLSKYFAESMGDINQSFFGVTDYTLYKKLKLVCGRLLLESARISANELLDKSEQSNYWTYVYDSFLLADMCRHESASIKGAILEFGNIDMLFSYLDERPEVAFKAITKMVRSGDGGTHYTCIDVLKEKGKIALVVYEPAWLSVNSVDAVD